ncbi:mitochondrial large ribosomal subunit protein L1, putative [Talaromyces stipitatus ATCC 10500]|uniref:Mitochondrial large ribosomal subunit protein L1, putative n=1 Tax=Talaromyces stipitatus (strain ATCC 10500 / CBS 375.48 / QM 6759 / NRRL 1006) TaxID=441959 RepID=B8MDK9_TALSN|nr:mitochondrial 54S ribosomal protein MRPL1 [Talaromyces stipitatus ATCC 10500]EED17972.1 mitochondrial large ribosomal subunit protein L1, putative [Talaromyces stipitatus ATCC 10500]
MAYAFRALPVTAGHISASCRSTLRQNSAIAPFLYPLGQQQVRTATSNPQAKGKKNKQKESKKKVKGARDYQQKDLSLIDQYALCDAMRYIRAFEVGRDRERSKYEIHIRLKSRKDGPVIRNMVRFPHAVQTESRICVIAPPGSKHAKDALEAGASIVGEQEVFENIKKGIIEFERCICHTDSLDALNKAGLGRILGPRGLMPSVKTGTVVDDVGIRVQMLRGGTVYRERDAVIRMPIGQLGFSPDQLRDNLRAALEQVKKDTTQLSDRVPKEVYEVVRTRHQISSSRIIVLTRYRY